jgi:hypothetical protein
MSASRSTWGARARRWGFRLAFVLSLVGVLVAYGTPLWYHLHDQKLLVLVGGSMSGTYEAGDAIVIQPIAPQELRVGQVVTFRSTQDGMVATTTGGYDAAPKDQTKPVLTTHRIIAIEEKQLRDPENHPIIVDGKPETHWFIRTKGDNDRSPDFSATDVSQIIGQVVGSLPRFGFFLLWSREPVGRLLLFAPPLLLLLGAELIAWRREGRDRKTESLAQSRPRPAATAGTPPVRSGQPDKDKAPDAVRV